MRSEWMSQSGWMSQSLNIHPFYLWNFTVSLNYFYPGHEHVITPLLPPPPPPPPAYHPHCPSAQLPPAYRQVTTHYTKVDTKLHNTDNTHTWHKMQAYKSNTVHGSVLIHHNNNILWTNSAAQLYQYEWNVDMFCMLNILTVTVSCVW
jgi:hypothetical protein